MLARSRTAKPPLHAALLAILVACGSDSTSRPDASTGGDAADAAVDAPQYLLPLVAAKWTRTSAPVLSKTTAPAWDSFSAYNPRIAKYIDGTPYRDDAGDYYMYFTATDGAGGTDMDQTGLALSPDLMAWRRHGTTPVLARGAPGSPDAGDCSAVTVLVDGSTFHAWFEGNSNLTGPSDRVTINYATSTDGKTWTKHANNPILSTGAGGDAEDLYAPVVMKDGATWRMWYTGHDTSGRYGVMYASAPAPEGPWTKHSTNYIFYPGTATFFSEVWREDGALYMLYFDSTSIVFATSLDGLDWTPRGIVLSAAPAGAWDTGSIYWPSMARIGSTWFLYYNANAYTQGIGYATTEARVR